MTKHEWKPKQYFDNNVQLKWGQSLADETLAAMDAGEVFTLCDPDGNEHSKLMKDSYGDIRQGKLIGPGDDEIKRSETPQCIDGSCSGTKLVGGHDYPGCRNGFQFTSDCLHGCGCWMGGTRSGASGGGTQDEIDPFGECPAKDPWHNCAVEIANLMDAKRDIGERCTVEDIESIIKIWELKQVTWKTNAFRALQAFEIYQGKQTELNRYKGK